MSITKLGEKRWRAQVHVPQKGNVGVGKILGGTSLFASKSEAKDARERARRALRGPEGDVTVGEWWTVWTTDPLWARPKASTNIHNAERTKHFTQAHRDLALARVDDMTVHRWLKGGQRNAQVPALKAMFNDAASAAAGRLIPRNPWQGLKISKGKGNAEVDPPPEDVVRSLIAHAERVACPSFAAWLQVAAFTGMRPGELDALRWDRVDLAAGRIDVAEQFSATSRTFTAPKNGKRRTALLTPPARDALVSLPREGAFCFRPPIRGEHFTPSSRAYYWKAIRAAAGYDGSLYLATRHFCGSYLTNVLELAAEDVAIALGHEDGGYLVRTLYGHRDKDMALGRVAQAFARAGEVRPLRVIDHREDAG